MPYPYHPPTGRTSPCYDMRSKVGVFGHLAFGLLCLGLVAAFILIVMVAGELRG